MSRRARTADKSEKNSSNQKITDIHLQAL